MTTDKWTMRDRVRAVMAGETPDRLPFIDRMEIWYKSHRAAGTLPPEYASLSLNEAHERVGMGRQKFSIPYALKLHGVEMRIFFENEEIYRCTDPEDPYFPAQYAPAQVPKNKAGKSRVEYHTPVGRVSVTYEYAQSMMRLGGVDPYLTAHLIQAPADYKTVFYIIERAEFVPRYEAFAAEEEALGSNGFLVPCIHRIPFQQALLEYLGEMALFKALYDDRSRLEDLIRLLDEQMEMMLRQLAASPFGYIEFGDNLDGMMTNPNLFKTYCLPHYQKYAEILHAGGKKMGSHTDGNLKPLVDLIPESGLDVCESFSPVPLTECTFEEAFAKWEKGPLIWGGIPCILLEERTARADFEAFVTRFLQTVGDRPIIVGVGDMVLDNDLIERVRYVADAVAVH